MYNVNVGNEVDPIKNEPSFENFIIINIPETYLFEP